MGLHPASWINLPKATPPADQLSFHPGQNETSMTNAVGGWFFHSIVMPMADRYMDALGPLRSSYEDLNPRTCTLEGDFKAAIMGKAI